MLIRIIYEDEEVAEIRGKLKTLTMRQLMILEDIVHREKESRQQEAFDEWLDVLHGYVDENKAKE